MYLGVQIARAESISDLRESKLIDLEDFMFVCRHNQVVLDEMIKIPF